MWASASPLSTHFHPRALLFLSLHAEQSSLLSLSPAAWHGRLAEPPCSGRPAASASSPEVLALAFALAEVLALVPKLIEAGLLVITQHITAGRSSRSSPPLLASTRPRATPASAAATGTPGTRGTRTERRRSSSETAAVRGSATRARSGALPHGRLQGPPRLPQSSPRSSLFPLLCSLSLSLSLEPERV